MARGKLKHFLLCLCGGIGAITFVVGIFSLAAHLPSWLALLIPVLGVFAFGALMTHGALSGDD